MPPTDPSTTLVVLDLVGIFVTGTSKALDYGLGPVPAGLMGMVTGIGGGMARDVLAGRVPAVFRGELYATPALAGAFVVVLGQHLDLPGQSSRGSPDGNWKSAEVPAFSSATSQLPADTKQVSSEIGPPSASSESLSAMTVTVSSSSHP